MRANRRYPSAAAAVAALALSLGTPAPAMADADGPDFYRVRDLQAGAALLIHADDGGKGPVIGWVPHDGVQLKNLGCTGGLNIVEWEKASPAERRAGRFRRWCKITYKGKTGWVNGGYLRE